MDAPTDTPSGPAHGGPDKADVGARCRKTASVALRAFIDLLHEVAKDGWVSLEQINRIGAAVMAAGGPLATTYLRAEAGCEAVFALLACERQRHDHLGRLVTENFSGLFEDPASGLERKNLPQFFAAMRLILGEDVYETLKARATLCLESHRQPDGLANWEAFYRDPEARRIVESVLVSMARSFRRFEPRCDWFLIVMNSNPSTISVGSNAFVARKAEDKVTRGFTEKHLCRLFEALFAEMRPEAFDDARKAAFVEKWNVEPEKIFGPLFIELRRLANRIG